MNVLEVAPFDNSNNRFQSNLSNSMKKKNETRSYNLFASVLGIYSTFNFIYKSYLN